MSSNASPIQTLRLICLAIASTNLVYFGVLFAIKRPDGMENPMLLPALGFAALSVAGASIVIPNLLWKNALKAQRIESKEQEDPDSPSGFRKTVRVAVDPGAALSKIRAGYATKTILGCALGESVGLFGFVLGMLGLAPVMTLPFFIVSLGLILNHYPSEGKMVQTAETALGIRIPSS
jgi:hypothetical protein